MSVTLSERAAFISPLIKELDELHASVQQHNKNLQIMLTEHAKQRQQYSNQHETLLLKIIAVEESIAKAMRL